MNSANLKQLEDFLALLDTCSGDSVYSSAEKWNRRAEQWQKERIQKRRGDERVRSAVEYLSSKGLLRPQDNVADIGCGPARFSAAFAQRVHHVLGLDISDQMIAHGLEYLRQEKISNVTLQVIDFETLNPAQAGYRAAFDLVFFSMTPAVHSLATLQKAMDMCRGHCCCVTHLGGRNLLRARLVRELFGREPRQRWSGRWFYALFNVLYLLGYQPETSYEDRHQELWVEPDEDYAAFLMEHALAPEETTAENAIRILAWLRAQQNADGLVKEVIDTSYGRILWDVRIRTGRPDYATG